MNKLTPISSNSNNLQHNDRLSHGTILVRDAIIMKMLAKEIFLDREEAVKHLDSTTRTVTWEPNTDTYCISQPLPNGSGVFKARVKHGYQLLQFEVNEQA